VKRPISSTDAIPGTNSGVEFVRRSGTVITQLADSTPGMACAAASRVRASRACALSVMRTPRALWVASSTASAS
jgi:hypothetical protein